MDESIVMTPELQLEITEQSVQLKPTYWSVRDAEEDAEEVLKPDEKTWVSSDQGCLALSSPDAYRNKQAEMQLTGRWSCRRCESGGR